MTTATDTTHPDDRADLLAWIAGHDDPDLVDLANLWHGYSYLGTLSPERSARYDAVLDALVADGTLVRSGDRYIGFTADGIRTYARSFVGRDRPDPPHGADVWLQEHLDEWLASA